MAIGWLNKSTMPAHRTSLADGPDLSKNVRRYGPQGSRIDAPYKSTGEDTSEPPREQAPPSAPSHSSTQRAVPHQATVGWDPHNPGKFNPVKHVNAGAHGLDGHHDREKSTDGVKGQAWSSGGPRFPQSRPAAKKAERASYDHPAQPSQPAHPASLNGDSDRRVGYNGGRGKI